MEERLADAKKKKKNCRTREIRLSALFLDDNMDFTSRTHVQNQYRSSHKIETTAAFVFARNRAIYQD